MVTLLVVMTAGTVLGVIVLAHDILVAARGVTATVLLGRGAAIWVANVIIFSLWYWEFDRGGPAERAAGAPVAASFAFPENATPELAPPGWRPAYPDYLYLAFTNATAFSPTDTLPVRRVGQADHDDPVGAVAGDRDPGGRQGHQRPARLIYRQCMVSPFLPACCPSQKAVGKRGGADDAWCPHRGPAGRRVLGAGAWRRSRMVSVGVDVAKATWFVVASNLLGEVVVDGVRLVADRAWLAELERVLGPRAPGSMQRWSWSGSRRPGTSTDAHRPPA